MNTSPLESSGGDHFVIEPRHHTRWANASLRVEETRGQYRVVKDFSRTHWLFRATLARLYVWHERRACHRLQGLSGFPAACGRASSLAFRYEFIPGRTLREARRKGETLPPEYFPALERLVFEMHRRNVVHLDLRNARNILVSEEGAPVIIDLQTALFCDHMPGLLRRLLKAVDRSAVYKHWRRLAPESMGAARTDWFQRFERYRGLWPFRGYPLQKMMKPGKNGRR